MQKATDTSTFTNCASAPASWRPRSFQYDSLSRLLSATNPESGTITYSYDANGNVASKVSPKQNQGNPNTKVTLSYCYDALNRLTGKAYTAQSCPLTTPAATYSYDQGTNGIGRRTGMTDSPGSSNWTYDIVGRVLSETRVTSGVTKTASYSYNLDGSVKSATYPSTRTLNYTYNPTGGSLSAGHPISVIDTTGPINYVTAATYAPFGGLTGMYNGIVAGGFTGIITTNLYNQRLQPCRLSARTTGSAPSPCTDSAHIGNVLDLRYDFHAGTGDNGNVFQIINNHDGNRTQNFTYDNLNRIQQAYSSGSIWGETFGSQSAPGSAPSTPGIDAWGNLWQRSAVTGKTLTELMSVAVLNNNQLSGFGYDAAGNMTSNGSTSYNYDQENRLTKFITTSTDIYIYDGNGRRVKKNAAAITLYWYDTNGNVIDETSSTGALISEYIYFNGKRVARRDASNNVHYYFSDHLSSASVVTDAVGTMSLCPAGNSPMNYTTIPTGEEESDFYPYGGEMKLCDRAPQNYKFTGKERDSESGLDMLGARYYGSSLGRFMQTDPFNIIRDAEDRGHLDTYLLQPQNWNRYAYTWNNPLKYVDPTGETVYVVTYTVGNESGDDEFKKAAQTRANEIQKSKDFDPKKDTVLVEGVNSLASFKNVINTANGMEKQFGKVGEVDLFSHAGDRDGPNFNYGHNREGGPHYTNEQNASGLMSLHVNWDSPAQAKFFGCFTAKFAQGFANSQHVPTYGFPGYSGFSSFPNFRDYGYVFGLGSGLYMTTRDGRPPVRKDPTKPH